MRLVCQLSEVLRRPGSPQSLVTEGAGVRGVGLCGGWRNSSEPSFCRGQVAHGARDNGPHPAEFEGCMVPPWGATLVFSAWPVPMHTTLTGPLHGCR